jgi:uncharacterized membrane protein YeaQ/YmgE (transglycosylase-associated protein family)
MPRTYPNGHVLIRKSAGIPVSNSLSRCRFGANFFEKDGTNVSILSWIIVGLIAGALAKMVVPGEGPGGIIGDMIVGIVGAFLGGWIFNFFGHSGLEGLSLWSIIVAFVGAVVLLFILRALTGGRRRVV